MAPRAPKTWLVTGASSGIGRSLTAQALARGDRVAATVRRLEALDDLRNAYGERLWVARLDVTDRDAVCKVVDQAFTALGGVDVAVSNAGYGVYGAAEELSDHQIRHIVDTNLIGSIQVIRCAVTLMRPRGRGHILQLSSAGGQVSFPGFSAYHATKWGIEGFVESVAAETAEFGLRFTIVEPGGARTDFGARSLDLGQPIDVYENGRIGHIRRNFAARQAKAAGDPEKMAAAMIAVADDPDPPLRLTLGSDAYEMLRRGLAARLAALEAQKDVACSTDG